MIVVAILIAFIVGIIVGNRAKEDKLTIRMSEKKNIIIGKGRLLAGLFLCILMAFILSFKRDSISEKALSNQQDSSYKQVSNLEKQHTQEIEDALFKSDDKHKIELQNNTNSLTETFTKSTKDILADAGSNKNYLKHTIDSLQNKLDSINKSQLPNVTYPADGEVMNFVQSNDSFFVLPIFRNSGGGVAKNINLILYFIYVDGGTFYEYFRPLGTAVDMEIPAKESKITQKSIADCMYNFQFDSTKLLQFILILGSYTNDDPKSKITKELKLCYQWNTYRRGWDTFSGASHLERAHNDKSTIRFFHYP